MEKFLLDKIDDLSPQTDNAYLNQSINQLT